MKIRLSVIALAGILFFSLPLAGCAKTGEGSYHTSVLTIMEGIKQGKFIINEDAPETPETSGTNSGNGKIKNYGLLFSHFYGNHQDPALGFSIDGVEGNFIIVKIKNDTNKNRTASLESFFYPAQEGTCFEQYDYITDNNRYDSAELTVPRKKTVTLKVPIPNIPGPLSYCGAPYDY